ncbi:GNAT family N-acetyltransferase [Oleiharenicola lentus]|uniref:GNAT family N-acetyltransferase n=1 Tax=Oleiharenicola lentus TaxID=2508720 RepID=A0A4Q1CB27_9BACT|nr:GNAT family N-acetyltransferase [Oleiharenicola lentus]RXK56168.1 GNAT family N-acetyltransferase [Oleiharenicola lentus]
MKAAPWAIRRLTAVSPSELNQLAEVLTRCVEGGASVSFMLPLSRERVAAFWQRVADDVARGARILIVAEDSAGICGTVQLVLDLPENQPHRADLCKMLVHQRARKQGLGAALLAAAEEAARAANRTLLVLDAVSGADGARLYERGGWVRVGEIPRYALYPAGGYCPTTYYYKDLGTR